MKYGSVQALLFLKSENQTSFRERLIQVIIVYYFFSLWGINTALLIMYMYSTPGKSLKSGKEPLF